MLKSINYLISILLTVSVTMSLKAQNSRQREFQQIILIENDTIKCRRLINYAENVRDSLHDYNLALHIYEKADSILWQHNYPEFNVIVDYNRGFTYFLKGNYKRADQFYVDALDSRALDKQPTFKAKILHNAAVNLTRIKVFKRAMAYYDEALAIYTNIKDTLGIGSTYFNMSRLFSTYGNDQKSAKELLNKASKILGENIKLEEQYLTLSARAYEHARAEKYDSAKILLIRALNSILKRPLQVANARHSLTSAEGYVSDCSSLAGFYANLEKWDSCFFFLDKAKHISDSLKLAYSINGEYYDDLGYCYDLKEDFTKALYYYKKALAIKISWSNCRFLLENIADIYLYQKQYDSAFAYKEKAIKYSDSLYKSELTDYIDFENKRIEHLEKEYKNQLKSAEQERSLETLATKNYVLISIVILLTLGVLLLYIYFRQFKLRIKKEHLQSELDFLRAQLNPHFLFNSINNIYVMLDKNKEEASNILLKFSELMRYQLYECNVSAIQLNKELQFLENYIKFEELRYSDKIKVEYKIDTSRADEFMIAPLLLQPFIENAFKHTPKKRDRQSSIIVNISLSESELLLEVSNTMNLDKVSELPGGIGLKNVKKRLKLLYPGKHELKVIKSEQDYSVTLKLKLSHD